MAYFCGMYYNLISKDKIKIRNYNRTVNKFDYRNKAKLC